MSGVGLVEWGVSSWGVEFSELNEASLVGCNCFCEMGWASRVG